jgi:hypothetical protein
MAGARIEDDDRPLSWIRADTLWGTDAYQGIVDRPLKLIAPENNVIFESQHMGRVGRGILPIPISTLT